MLKRRSAVCAIAAVVLASGGTPGIVSAQDGADDGRLEEIVVTSRRREESVQNVPISIAAFDYEELELRGITELEDLNTAVPNVTMAGSELTGPSTGASDPARYTIRGLPGVGVYIDGIWDANNTNTLTSNIVDVERIEVLRGPQGTLFGKNTLGGAIQIVTARPADEFAARVGVTVGSDERFDVTGRVDIPINDSLKTKWTAASLKRDGYIDSVTIDQSYGDTDQTVLRGDILWSPSESFNARFIYEQNDTNQDGIPRITTGLTAGSDPNTPICATACAYNIVAAAGTNPLISPINNETHVSGFAGGDLDFFENRSVQTVPGFISDTDSFTLDLNWFINDSISVRSLTGIKETDRKLALDFDGTEYILLQQNQFHEDKQSTQELQLIGNHERFNWVLGAFLFDDESTEYQARYAYTEFNGQSPAGIPGNRCDRSTGQYALVQPTGDFAVVNDAIACFSFTPSTPSLELHAGDGYALFGEGTFSVTDRFDVTLGLRFTDETRREARFAPGLAQNRDPNVFTSGNPYQRARTFLDEEADFDAVTGRLALQYRFNDDTMVYGSYSEGFNAGRINSYTPPFFAPPFILPINEETVETVEFGIKSDWLEGRLRVNASVFLNDFEDLHAPITTLNAAGAPVPLQTTLNVGSASADGVEVDATWLLNDNWRVDVSIAAIDTEYDELLLPDDDAIDVGFGDNFFSLASEFPRAPDTSYTAGIQYDADVPGGGAITSRLQYGWRDDTRMHPNDAIAVIQPSYGLLNFRLHYHSPERNYRISLFGDNLTDEEYLISAFSTENLGVSLSTAGRPLQVGAELTFFIN